MSFRILRYLEYLEDVDADAAEDTQQPSTVTGLQVPVCEILADLADMFHRKICCIMRIMLCDASCQPVSSRQHKASLGNCVKVEGLAKDHPRMPHCFRRVRRLGLLSRMNGLWLGWKDCPDENEAPCACSCELRS